MLLLFYFFYFGQRCLSCVVRCGGCRREAPSRDGGGGGGLKTEKSKILVDSRRFHGPRQVSSVNIYFRIDICCTIVKY